MSTSARVRDRSSGRLVDPRQLTLDLHPCAVAGVSSALLSPSECVALARVRHDRIFRSGPGRPPRLALWSLYWLPPGAFPSVGDSYHVREPVSRGL